MDNDLLLVIGLVVCVFSIPSLISAVSERRAPRTGGILMIAGAIMIAAALTRQPGSYTWGDLPEVFANAFARLTR